MNINAEVLRRTSNTIARSLSCKLPETPLSRCWQRSQKRRFCLVHDGNSKTNGLLATSTASRRPIRTLCERDSIPTQHYVIQKRVTGKNFNSVDASKKEKLIDDLSKNSNLHEDDEKWEDFGITRRDFQSPKTKHDGIISGKRRRRKLSSVNIFKTSSSPSFPPTTWKYFRKRQMMIKNEKDSMDDTEICVESIHVAQTIDLVAVLSKVFGTNNNNARQKSNYYATKHQFGKNSLIMQLTRSGGEKMMEAGENTSYTNSYMKDETSHKFVAVFRFGSIVFFHFSDQDRMDILKHIREEAVISGLSPPNSKRTITGLGRKEYFQVAIRPSIVGEARVYKDFAVVPKLTMDSVAVISTIMAQTVALDTYSDIVDGLLANFDSINTSVKHTGNFTSMDREALFKAIAQNNSIMIDMMSKLGIKERSDTAWNLSQYEQIHEGLRDEFEIDDRFDQIELKLNMIQGNAKFFLDIIHNQKSNVLEWVIIVLIFFECSLMLMEMSGLGEKIFRYTDFTSASALTGTGEGDEITCTIDSVESNNATNTTSQIEKFSN